MHSEWCLHWPKKVTFKFDCTKKATKKYDLASLEPNKLCAHGHAFHLLHAFYVGSAVDHYQRWVVYVSVSSDLIRLIWYPFVMPTELSVPPDHGSVRSTADAPTYPSTPLSGGTGRDRKQKTNVTKTTVWQGESRACVTVLVLCRQGDTPVCANRCTFLELYGFDVVKISRGFPFKNKTSSEP